MRRALTVCVLGFTTLLCYSGGAQTQVHTPDNPVVKSAEAPFYPLLARQARIEGTVQVQVTTDGSSVTKAVASGAHKMLLDAAEQNVQTWRFLGHKPQTFSVTFVYKLEQPEVDGAVNSRVLLEYPNRVEIRAKMATVESIEMH